MIWFVGGALLFFGGHLLPLFPGLRRSLLARLGPWPYRGLFAVLAGAGLVLMVVGYGRMETTTLWFVPAWAWRVNPPLMMLASILLVAAYLPGNVRRLTRHPMLWAVVLWGVAHMLVTGHLAAVLLFGAFIAYATLAMKGINMRGAELQQTSRNWLWDGLNGVVGLAVYFLILRIHAWLGVPVG